MADRPAASASAVVSDLPIRAVYEINDIFDALGIKAGVVFAGLSGGFLRGLSRRRYTPREMVASPFCGALVAAYLTEPALLLLARDQLASAGARRRRDDATAFVVGVCAMWIADLLFEAMMRCIKGGRPVPRRSTRAGKTNGKLATITGSKMV